ncbi:hypothetical protein [Marinomonas mediterranea]|jgi:hypothetical protein|uniref:Uncharacterized protein n=1 Tax=Marinomonas mediterranea (strain ATCC 700492 / JCM 21426 / NBRC 103028 / MMB-1) TaxID=717774 RepID=F2JYB9_MARM1|nr:hypothetical protein [Marinomonas mediterranea]ADZ91950.1 hypothetical protein Marme_2720 [Marinomonas mediterranea MMB-1]WCN09903.1 hypothetical protein GV055_13740 [Marinomonas mediterranea]WCN13983.1 hypothetical protein GV054_13730 [Marinomonas mediterranea]WCN18033.1 hypothetical protein GV053_13755 [Marinomonas mediterranea MMB-1]
MAGEGNVNSQVVNTVDQMQNSALSSSVIKLSGAGKAYQSISQSSAIAVQDATDNLRNINTMATTAMGVALAQMLATGNTEMYGEIIKQANTMIENSTSNFNAVGKGASQLLDEFTTGG